MIRGMGLYVDGRPTAIQQCAALVGEIPGDPDMVGRMEDLYSLCRRMDNGFLWIGLFEPTRAELHAVQKIFDLDPLRVEDASNKRQRAKAEWTREITFAVFKVLGYIEATSDVETAQVSVFLGNNFVITVRLGTVGDLRGARTRLELAPELLRHGPISVLYTLLDTVVDGYLHVSEEMTTDIEQIEATVFSSRTTDDAPMIYKLKVENLELRRAVAPLAPVAHALVRELIEEIPAELRPFFHDVGDHMLRVADTTEANDSLLMAMLQVWIGRQGLQQNADMRRITAYAAMIGVPTLIAGIYGMNFDDMPELHWRFGYPLALGLMIGIVLLMRRAFKNSGWL